MDASELRELTDTISNAHLVPDETFRKMRGEANKGFSSYRLYPYEDCVVHKTRSGSGDQEHLNDMNKVIKHLTRLGYKAETFFKFGDKDLGVNYIKVNW